MASVGVIATAVLSAKATPAALKLIDNAKTERSEKELTKKEEILIGCKVAWKCYAPAATVGALTVACIIGSNVLSHRQQVALMGAYAITQKSYADYKRKLKELCGEETHERIIDEIAKERCKETVISVQGLTTNSSLDFGDEFEPEIVRTFYDPVSARYFETSIAKVIEAEYHLNRNFMMSGIISVNDFYDFLGLANTEEGDNLGWASVDGDIFWIDFNHYITHLDDGMEVHVIEPVFDPVIDFDGNI